MSFSGRKYVTVAIISTYCIVIIASVILTVIKLMELAVFLALISGLGGLTMYIVKAYFDDKERALPENITSTTTTETKAQVKPEQQNGGGQ